MPIFAYKGVNKQGKEVKGSVNTDGIASAKQKVSTLGIMLLSIEEEKSGGKTFSFSFGQKVNINDLSLMTRQLATLIKARIQIVEALQALVDQVDNATLRVVLAEVRQKINEGSSLAHALSDYPKIFSNVYVNMVEAGEASGTLDIVLLRLAEFTEAQVKLKNKITGAMTYPVIMAAVGSVMMGFIFVVIIPKITKIFITMKKELPLPTRICINISNFLQNYWWAAIIGVFVLIWLVKKYLSTQKGTAVWHKWQLKLPIIGPIATMINVSRFCSTLATLLGSGVPILTSLQIVKNLVSNVHMQNAVEVAKANVSEGASMVPALLESGYFPPMVTHMIKLGENSGELEPMLKIISENYEDQVNSKLEGLTSILEPIMMVCMGGAVAFIVISVIIPMMSLNSTR